MSGWLAPVGFAVLWHGFYEGYRASESGRLGFAGAQVLDPAKYLLF